MSSLAGRLVAARSWLPRDAILLGVAMFCVVSATNIMTPLLPAIQDDFAVSITTAGVIVGSFGLARLAGRPAGRLPGQPRRTPPAERGRGGPARRVLARRPARRPGRAADRGADGKRCRGRDPGDRHPDRPQRERHVGRPGQGDEPVSDGQQRRHRVLPAVRWVPRNDPRLAGHLRRIGGPRGCCGGDPGADPVPRRSRPAGVRPRGAARRTGALRLASPPGPADHERRGRGQHDPSPRGAQHDPAALRGIGPGPRRLLDRDRGRSDGDQRVDRDDPGRDHRRPDRPAANHLDRAGRPGDR